MGLGILEPATSEHVPGTARLEDIGADERNVDVSNLRHNKNGIILVPQPSSSPNDPLNWPLWRKESLFLLLFAGIMVVGVSGPCLSPTLPQLAVEFKTSLATITQVTSGSQIITSAAIVPFSTALSNKIGKRPIYLAGFFIATIGCIANAVVTNLAGFTAARVIQGIAVTPIEMILNASVGDVWFVHQRGTRIGLLALSTLVSFSISAIVSGYVIVDLSWRWCFWLLAIAFGVVGIFAIPFMPETQYNRDVTTRILLAEGAKDETEVSHVETQTSQGEQKRSFVAEMSPWNPVYKGTEGFWENFTKPFPMLVSPIILFVFFINAFNTIWIILLGAVIAQIFLFPPYNFSAAGVGNTNVASLIGGVLGFFASGPVLDFCARKGSEWNKGIYEPEFRLWPVVLSWIFQFSGFMGFAYSIGEQSPWIGPVFCLGLINFGSSVGSNSAAPEAFAAIGILRNVVAFGFLFFINDWVAAQGPEKTFITIAGLLTAFHLLTIPMYFYGKRARMMVYTKGLVTEKAMDAVDR